METPRKTRWNLGQNLILRKHNLNNVQEGNDMIPFNTKMQNATEFIHENITETVKEFKNFGKFSKGEESEEEQFVELELVNK